MCIIFMFMTRWLWKPSIYIFFNLLLWQSLTNWIDKLIESFVPACKLFFFFFFCLPLLKAVNYNFSLFIILWKKKIIRCELGMLIGPDKLANYRCTTTVTFNKIFSNIYVRTHNASDMKMNWICQLSVT